MKAMSVPVTNIERGRLMREILFRGKNLKNDVWIYGNLHCTDDDGICIIQNHIQHHLLKDYEVNPKTVCQYIGLVDKNGRKIFEGDIIKVPYCRYDICTLGLRGCNYYFKGKQSDYEIASSESKHFEVMGNVFDNPELIL